ncbi:hypothetical protein RsTz2092_14030 [Deferribacterales bacterium RsTz2092]|nr:hypothetical protein AGMMS49941_10120 [Deferribacterales bacterium]
MAQFEISTIMSIIDKVSAPMKNIYKSLSANNSGFASLGRQMMSVGNNLGMVKKGLVNFIPPLSLIGGATIYSAVKGMKALVNSTAVFGDRMAKTADKQHI